MFFILVCLLFLQFIHAIFHFSHFFYSIGYEMNIKHKHRNIFIMFCYINKTYTMHFKFTSFQFINNMHFCLFGLFMQNRFRFMYDSGQVWLLQIGWGALSIWLRKLLKIACMSDIFGIFKLINYKIKARNSLASPNFYRLYVSNV